MTQVKDRDWQSLPAEPDQQVPEFITELAVLLKLGAEFEETWQTANEVCDRYGIGRAA